MPAPESRHLARRLTGATVAALALRFAYVFGPARNRALAGDPSYFRGLARNIADGHWFREPVLWVPIPKAIQTATHPPLFPLLLSLPARLGLDTVLQMRAVTAMIGVTLVPIVGLVAYRLGGPSAAITASIIAALNPAFWMNDVNVLSEAVLAPLLALLVLVAITTSTPTARTAAILGALVGLIALTRAEGLLFLPLLAFPALWRGEGGRRGVAARLGAATAATVVVLTPWTIYNLTRFDEPVLISNNLGGTLIGTSTDSVWYGPRTGWWQFGVPDPPSLKPTDDESVRNRELREAALDYVRAHERRLPIVVLARVGRVFGVYQPFQTTNLDGREGRGLWPARLGLAVYALLVVSAIPGVVWLVRRRAPIAWLVAPVVVVTVTASMFYGSPRFRVPADVSLSVAAAIGTTTGWRAVRSRTSSARRTPS